MPDLKDNATGRRRPRLLMLTYACVPNRGSEWAAGWNRAIQAGRFADTWVISEGLEYESAVRHYISRNGRSARAHRCAAKLGHDSLLVYRLSAGGRERVARCHWPRLGEQMARVYQQALDMAKSDAQVQEVVELATASEQHDSKVFVG